MSAVGTGIRLSRIINRKTKHGFCIAMDHALHLGNCKGLERPEEMLDLMAEAGVDAVILSLGSAIRYGSSLAKNGRPALILRLDQTTMWREGSPTAYPDGHTRLVASVDDAVSVGADAVINYLFVAHNDPAEETAAFRATAAVNAAARASGMVHIVETMGARHALAKNVHDGSFVAFHSRIGMEMGADLIKTDWPGSIAELRRITNELPIPVMLAGGPRGKSDRATLELVASIIKAGAAGILFGRAIFDAREPVAMMRACKAIVHGECGVDEAIERAQFNTTLVAV
jgi:DhnA family fructose-bisphosphate aldolase class Ia